MRLEDIGKQPSTTFIKINQHLKINYGFGISENISDKDLVLIKEHTESEIVELKIKGDDARHSSEISKRLLILEGIKTLTEYVNSGLQSPKLNFVIDTLARFVVDTFEISGMENADFEKAMERAMEEYRSSKYRFPDDFIEQRVRQEAITLLETTRDDTDLEFNPGSSIPMMEDTEEEAAQVDSEVDGISEDKWISTNPKKAGMFKGKTVAELKSQRTKLKVKHADQKGGVSDADKSKMAELNFAIRAKSEKGLKETAYRKGM